MSERVKEQLSACLDGELPAAEARLLLKRLASDGEERAVLERYALVGEALRDAVAPELLGGQFSRRIREQVSETAPASPPVWGGGLARLIGGGAVAAAVATFALLSLQQGAMEGQDGAQQAANGNSPVSYTVPQPPDRLSDYLVLHGGPAAVARPSAWTRVTPVEPDGDAPESDSAEPTADPAPETGTDERP